MKRIEKHHLIDFLLNMTKDHIDPERRAAMYFKDDRLPLNPLRRRFVYNLHRKRSIHVHVWNRITFRETIERTIDTLDLPLTVIESAPKTPWQAK